MTGTIQKSVQRNSRVIFDANTLPNKIISLYGTCCEFGGTDLFIDYKNNLIDVKIKKSYLK